VTGVQTCALPIFLGMALCCKFNAIMQGRMIITDLDISSEQGDNVVYCHNVQEVSGPLEQSGWWHDTEPVYAEHTVNRNQRVIAINRDVKWHDLDLGWEPKEESKESDIVVTSFKRDDK